MKGGWYSRLGMILLCCVLIPTAALSDNRKTIQVDTIEVTGSTIFGPDDFLPVLAEYTHRNIAFEELQKAAEKVTSLYQRHGYLLVKAFIPEQDFAARSVRIEVMEGRLGDIVIEGSHQYYSDDFIRKHFDPVKAGGQVYDQEKLERAVLTLNDYMKLNVSATLRPGTSPGTSDLLVTANNSMPVNVSLDYNNFGSKYTSRNRIGVTFEAGNVGLEGSKFVFRGITGESPSDLMYGKVDYSLPLNPLGTRLGFTAERGSYDVGRELQILNITGDIESYGVYASHAFIRRKQMSVTGRGGFEIRNAEQDLLGQMTSEDKIRTINLGVEYEAYDAAGRSFAGFGVAQGLGSFLGGMDSNAFYASRYNADGSFTKLTASAMRVHRLDPSIYGLVRGSGQYATNNLVASELFNIGGGNSVRGYSMGEYAGDHGFQATAEIRFAPLAEDKELLQLAAFIDYGWVGVRDPVVGQSKNHDLTGVGVGARLNLPYDFDISADIGFPMSPSESAEGDDVHFYLSAMKKF